VSENFRDTIFQCLFPVGQNFGSTSALFIGCRLLVQLVSLLRVECDCCYILNVTITALSRIYVWDGDMYCVINSGIKLCITKESARWKFPIDMDIDISLFPKLAEIRRQPLLPFIYSKHIFLYHIFSCFKRCIIHYCVFLLQLKKKSQFNLKKKHCKR